MSETPAPPDFDFRSHLDEVFASVMPIGEASLKLWEALSIELSMIIGEVGFQSLYSRCLYQVAKEFPWLRYDQMPYHQGSCFLELQVRFDGIDRAQAELASRAQFACFITLLNSMIGVGLSRNIVHAAWTQKVPPESDVKDSRAPHEPP